MAGPGEYRLDPTEGMTRIEDLPKTEVRCQSRNSRSLGGRTTSRQLGCFGRQGLEQLGHGGKDRLVQVAKDVERAEVVPHTTRRPQGSAPGTAPSRRS
jgi:hypothetical protein